MLDNLPVGSIVFILGCVLIAFGYVTNDISIDQSFDYLWKVGAGAGAIGVARAMSGKGVRK